MYLLQSIYQISNPSPTHITQNLIQKNYTKKISPEDISKNTRIQTGLRLLSAFFLLGKVSLKNHLHKIIYRLKVTQSEKKVSLRIKKVTQSKKKVPPSNKKVAQSEKKVPPSNKKVAQSEKKVTPSNKKVAQSKKKVPLSNKKVTQSEKKLSLRTKKLFPASNQIFPKIKPSPLLINRREGYFYYFKKLILSCFRLLFFRSPRKTSLEVVIVISSIRIIKPE